MEFESTPILSLRATFESAIRFGLSHDEVWQTYDDALQLVGPDATLPEYLNEVSGGLSRRILAKQRLIHN